MRAATRDCTVSCITGNAPTLREILSVMKNPPLPGDRKRHDYCIACRAEAVRQVTEDDRDYFDCRECGHRAERRLVMDPAMRWWVAPDGEYWHESAGVFARNPDGTFLFLRRKMFPVGSTTVPSGHVDLADKSLEIAAAREFNEETGLLVDGLVAVATDDIVGDSCRRGSDAHRWHSFKVGFDPPIGPEDLTLHSDDPEESDELEEPVWLTLDEALQTKLTYPVRYVIERHRDELEGP